MQRSDMRYLRMFSNSALGGALGAAFITILVLQLNPQLPLSWSVVAPLYGLIALFYAVHLAVAFYALLVVWQLAVSTVHSPGWISLRLMSWIGTLVVSAGAALMWLNLASFRIVLEEDHVRRLAAGAGATTVCAVLLAIITVVHYSFGRRGSRVGGTLLVLTLAASLLFPLTARGLGPAASAGRPRDRSRHGGSGGFRRPARHVDCARRRVARLHLAEDRRRPPPEFRPRADQRRRHAPHHDPADAAGDGVVGGLDREISVEERHPVGGDVRLRGRDSRRSSCCPTSASRTRSCTSASCARWSCTRRACARKPIWTILSSQRVPAGIVGWPLTAPADPLRGFLISDRFHRSATSPLEFTDEDLGYPASAVFDARVLQQSGVPAAWRAGVARAAAAAARRAVSRGRGAVEFAVSPASAGAALRGARSRRASVPALRAAARVRRRVVGRAPALRRGARRALRVHRRRSRQGDVHRSARTTCCSSSPASAWSR